MARAAGIVVGESAGVRTLHFGSRWIQGAMRLQRPWALELDYTRAMLVPLALGPAAPWPARILIVGLGAGSFVRWFWRHRPLSRMTVVEIDARVVDVARLHFKLPNDEGRIAIRIGDAADVVPRLEPGYDLVLVDGFDALGRAGRLDHPAFYAACRAVMGAGPGGGVGPGRAGTRVDPGHSRGPGGPSFLAVNLLARTRGVAPALSRLASAFGDQVRVLAPCASGNTVAIAGRGADWGSAPGRAAAADALKRETGLDLRSAVASLA